MEAQNKEKERQWNDEFVKRTGGYTAYSEELNQLFDIFHMSSLPKDSFVLDAGCGTGRCSFPIASLGFKVIGIDISEKAIEVARQEAEKAKLSITFQEGDIEALPFEDNTFDIVFCGGVLHHFPDSTKAEKEIYRVLKEKGKFFAYEPNRSNPVTFFFFAFAKLSWKFFPSRYIGQKFSENERLISAKELGIRLRHIGFAEINFDFINIQNKGRNCSRRIKNQIRKRIYSFNEAFLPSLRKGSHLALSCIKK